MNNGTVEFVDFNGETQLTLPPEKGAGPKKFTKPSVATITLEHDTSKYENSIIL